MAEFTQQIPIEIQSLEHLASLLSFWNEEICKKERGGKSCIFSVFLGTEGPDLGKNLVWFKDTTTPPVAPAALRDFKVSLSDEERRKAILKIETDDQLEARSSAIVLIGGEKKWVALFDKATAHIPPGPGPAPSASKGKISSDHFLDIAEQVPIEGGNPITPILIVIHYTEGFTAESSYNDWREHANKPGPKRGVLAHVVVDRDGTIFQCRPFNVSCGHAGASRWKDPRESPSKEAHDGVNSLSIGIEIANTGMKQNLHAKLGTGSPFPEGATVEARHRNGNLGSEEARGGRRWETYPEAQLAAVFNLVSLLMAKYDIHDITGHDCVSPDRKADPGPVFPMQALREANGFTGLPKVWSPNGTERMV